jgi:hypothetical protein
MALQRSCARLIAIAFDLHDSFYAVFAWQATASFHRFTISTLKM